MHKQYFQINKLEDAKYYNNIKIQIIQLTIKFYL